MTLQIVKSFVVVVVGIAIAGAIGSSSLAAVMLLFLVVIFALIIILLCMNLSRSANSTKRTRREIVRSYANCD